MKMIYLLCVFFCGAVCTMGVSFFCDNWKLHEMRESIGKIPSRMLNDDFDAQKEVDELHWRIAHGFTFPLQKKLLLELVENLQGIDLNKVSYSSQSMVIRRIYTIQRKIWDRILPPNATEKEDWKYKLEGLRWYKSQADRLSRIPSDASTIKHVVDRYNKKKQGSYNDYIRWKTCCKNIQGAFMLDLKQCVQEAEDDRYSDEFRAWCFKEIEKIIGRPLTDDDIMFKDDVLKRRARRKKQKEGKE